MSFLSYSQNLEDVMLWRALHHIKSGFYIDIGAWSPDLDSVTRLFYEQGWNGINIEPHPEYYKQLIEKRKSDINLNLGIGDKIGYEEIYLLGDSNLSTFNFSIANKYEDDLGLITTKKNIEVVTLRYIWSKYISFGQQVHFLKIDVVGFEKEVLQGNDWGKNRPWIIVINAVIAPFQMESYKDWEGIIVEEGYVFVYTDGVNRFYVAEEHNDLFSCFKNPPNVFDGFISIKQKELEESLFQETKRAEFAEFSSEQLRLDLQKIYRSRSWRLTYPLRLINKIRKGIIEKGVYASLKIAIEKLIWYLKGLVSADNLLTDDDSYIEGVEKKKIERNYYDENWYLIKNELGESFFYSPVSHIFQENIKPNESVYFNLHHAIKKYSPKGICLVFFMGMGDYLFVTPFISQLKKEFPYLKILALVSKNQDVYNSPLVADLVGLNKNIDDVRLYDGFINRGNYKSYNYKDAIKNNENDFLLVPVIYEYNSIIKNRAESLCVNYGLKFPESSTPKIDLMDKNEKCDEIVSNIICKADSRKINSIVILHLETRSSNYMYPFKKELCELLLNDGCMILSFTNISYENDNLIELDVKDLKIYESIYIISKIFKKFVGFFSMITTPSVIGAVSSGLGIVNLQLQHRRDYGLRSIFYDNLFLLTNHKYRNIPESRMFLVKSSEYSLNTKGYVDYYPNSIMKSWRKLLVAYQRGDLKWDLEQKRPSGYGLNVQQF